MRFSSRDLLHSGLTAASLVLAGCALSPQTAIPPYQSRRQPAYDAVPNQLPQVLAKPHEDIPPADQAAYSSQVLEPAMAKISGRIAAYEEKLQAWQRLAGGPESLSFSPEQVAMLISCRNEVADLHEEYSRLQAKLLSRQSAAASRELLFRSLQEFKERDIAYLEGACPQLFTTLSAVPSGSGEQTANSASPVQEETPGQAAVEGLAPPPAEGQGQIEIGSMQTVGSPAAAEPPAQEQQNGEARYQQGMDQLKNGHEQEARSLFSSLLNEARQQNNRQLEIRTLRTLAELEFGFRDYAAARRRYLELERLDGSSGTEHLAALEAVGARREELDAYAALLLGALTYKPDQDGFTTVQQAEEFVRLFPDSHLADNAADLGRKAKAKAEQWFSGLIAATDRLRAAQKQEEALKLLDQVPLDILPLDKQELLRQKKGELGSSAESAAGSAPAQEQAPLPQPDKQDKLPVSPAAGPAPQEAWNQGVSALEAEEYDQAISIFSGLRGTSLAAEAEAKTEEAARLAGQKTRKKAAELFQQASGAADPWTKKKLLLSSKSLLEDILRKYPQAGIEDKVRRNLSRVEQELAALGQAAEPE